MALKITDSCINCSICEPECPNHAIYPPVEQWSFSEGTLLSGTVTFPDGDIEDVNEMKEPLSTTAYFIVPWKCTECVGFHEEPRCAAVCPENCCVKDPDFPETKKELQEKKEFLH